MGGFNTRSVDPVTNRPAHRLTTLYALEIAAQDNFHAQSTQLDSTRISDHLNFGRLTPHYRTAGDQFPVVLLAYGSVGAVVTGPRQSSEISVSRFRAWLFRVPHGGFVAGLTVDFTGQLSACIPLLEDAYYGELTIAGQRLLQMLRAVAPTDIAHVLEDAEPSTHGHQLLFLGDRCGDLVAVDGDAMRIINHDLIRRLIYRFDAPYRQDSGNIRFPPEANRNMRSLAACGPYFSILVSQQDYVENSALVSAIQLVGSCELLSTSRRHAFDALATLRLLQHEIDKPDGVAYRQIRRRLATLSERVGRLELDLSFGIEAYHEIAALVPSLRVSGLHRELFEAAALPDQTRSVAQILGRLARAITAESASVLASERSRDERRRLAWGVAVGFASFIAIPLTLIFGFFAVATPDVSSTRSLLDIAHYKWFYATVGGLMLLTVLFAGSAWFYTRDRQ
jgi:hypothetical protein